MNYKTLLIFNQCFLGTLTHNLLHSSKVNILFSWILNDFHFQFSKHFEGCSMEAPFRLEYL